MLNIYSVSFKDGGKLYNFYTETLDCPINVTVIVNTERGLQFGKVVKKLDENSYKKDMMPIIRIANKDDYKKYLNNLKLNEEALLYAKSLVHEKKINMSIIDANYTFDRKQLLLNFISDERVDFRELAKLLASKYKTRIELRQIGARDKAREVSGIGICGRKLCCSGFLNKLESVNINMAKNQNLALNPSKINGICGRLLCCLSYEDEQYSEYKKDLPSIGDIINTEYGAGKVIFLDILNKKYKVLVNNEVKEIIVD